MKYLSDYTIIDIETSGLSPHNDKIIELSAIRIRNNKIESEFSELINPNKDVNPFITNLTGITNDMLKNAESIENILPKFIYFIKDDILLGHNIKFDIGFIRNNLKKYFDLDITNQTIDTMNIARNSLKLPNYKLQTIANHYNIDTKNNHRGLKDCYITFEVYNQLTKVNTVY